MPRILPPSRLLMFTVCLLAITGSCQAAPITKTHRASKQVREQIDALEEEFRTATLNGDAALMDHLLSDDYVGISWTGQVNTKAMQLDRIRNRTVSISRMDLSDVKVKLLGPVVIVTCAATIEGNNEGNPMSGAFRYTRVYQRLPGGIWKITNFEATRIPNHHRRGDLAPPSLLGP